MDTAGTPGGGEAPWRSSQPLPHWAILFHTRVARDPAPLAAASASASAAPRAEAIPLPLSPGLAGPQRTAPTWAGGRGAPPFWIRTVREPPPARRGAGSGLAEPRARARVARARAARAGGGGGQRRKGVVGSRAAAASGLLSGGSAPSSRAPAACVRQERCPQPRAVKKGPESLPGPWLPPASSEFVSAAPHRGAAAAAGR